MSKKELVAVYGTLKKGHGNHGVMERAKGNFLGECWSKPKFTMISLGGFPGVLLEGNTPIKLEIYEVEDMDPLDWLEGYPEFYNRKKITTPMGDAWMYYLPDKYADPSRIVATGEW